MKKLKTLALAWVELVTMQPYEVMIGHLLNIADHWFSHRLTQWSGSIIDKSKTLAQSPIFLGKLD